MLPSPPVPGPVVLVAIAYIVYHTAIRKTTYEDALCLHLRCPYNLDIRGVSC